MRIFSKWLASFFLMLLAICNQAWAQTEAVAAESGVEMADALRQDGKIYIVVIVLLTLLAGVVAYLVVLDRKVSKLEKMATLEKQYQ